MDEREKAIERMRTGRLMEWKTRGIEGGGKEIIMERKWEGKMNRVGDEHMEQDKITHLSSTPSKMTRC